MELDVSKYAAFNMTAPNPTPDAIPKPHPLAAAEFATLREKLLKVGARRAPGKYSQVFRRQRHGQGRGGFRYVTAVAVESPDESLTPS
jgi:hypothetical protein